MVAAPIADDPLDRARRLADDVLFPHAQEVDRAALVPRSQLDALAAAGLFGLAGPVDDGGQGVDPQVARHVIATVGGGCGATFFVWVQHHGVVRTILGAENPDLRDELLVPMLRGDVLCGTAFAHVRRTGPPAIRATRVDGGWRLDGHAPWATSWGLADHFSVAAESPDGALVWAIVPGASGPTTGMTTAPLPLPVFAATGTVTVDFEGCVVPDERVALVEDLAAWRATDRLRAAIGQPAVLGVAERAIRLLAGTARGDGDPAAHAATRLRDELAATWARDDALTAQHATVGAHGGDERDRDQYVAAASAHRARSLDLARRATTALLAAVGGRGMALDHPAQRLAREATFYVIQAQTTDGRTATLDGV